MRVLLLTFILVLLTAALPGLCAPDYRLAPEDVVTVTILRHEEFSGDFLVPADGIVSFPGAGEVVVSGKDLSELTDILTKKLSSRLKNPEVTISLKAQRQLRVYVLGSVNKPGVYDAKPDWRITECVAAAGGIIGEAADSRVSVLCAATGEQRSVKLVDVLRSTSTDNLPVQPNDVVNVETAKTLPVYVMGSVKNPGMYNLREDAGGILEAITLAGGAMEDAALSRVALTSVSGKSEVLDLSAADGNTVGSGNRKLQPGDLVVVPQSTDRVAVLGYVNQPGYYDLKDGQKITLADAVGMAGGIIPRKGQADSILVMRSENGEQQKLVYNLSKFLRAGDPQNNPAIKPGDVIYVSAGKNPNWESLIRLLSSVSIFANAVY